jgi:hypothetical protein
MTDTITATFIGTRWRDSGRDQSPDYYVYNFTAVTDSNGKIYGDKWIKETQLLKRAKLQSGKKYEIRLSEIPFRDDSVSLPHPIEIRWDDEKVCLRNGNKVIHVDKDGNETDLSYSKVAQELGQAKRKFNQKLKKNGK